MPRFAVPRAAAAALLIGAASVAAECAPVDVILEERLGKGAPFELPTGYVVNPTFKPMIVAACAREKEGVGLTFVKVHCDTVDDKTKIEAFDVKALLPGWDPAMEGQGVPWDPQPERIVFNAGWPLNPDHNNGDNRHLPAVFLKYQLAHCEGLYEGVDGDALEHRSGVVEARVTIRKSLAPTAAQYGVYNKVDPANVASDSTVVAYFAGRALKELRTSFERGGR